MNQERHRETKPQGNTEREREKKEMMLVKEKLSRCQCLPVVNTETYPGESGDVKKVRMKVSRGYEVERSVHYISVL